MTLRKQVFSGVRWTTLSSIGRALLQFIQLAILARLLEPADFGLIALVLATQVFLKVFADASISNVVIHHQDISHSQLSSLFWFNLFVSIVLAALLVISSYWVAEWYQQPDLHYLLMVAAVTLFAWAIGQQLRAVARKKMQFKTLAKIDLFSALIGAVVALALAFKGGGAYSLIVGSLVTAITCSGLVWQYLSEGWRPRLKLNLHEIRDHIGFGAYMVGNNLVNAFNAQIDVVMGGYILGINAIGLYSVPKDITTRLNTLINPIITQVGLPVMAKLQGEELRLRRVFLQTMRMTVSINAPIFVFMAFFSYEIVYLYLGEKWEQSAPLLQLLAVVALLRSMGNPIGSLLMAKGRVGLSFKWNMFWFTVTVPAIYAGSYYGTGGMALVQLVLGIIGYWPGWYFLVRPLCGTSFISYLLQHAVPMLLSLFAGLSGYFSVWAWEGNGIRLMVGGVVFGITYGGLSWIFNRQWVDSIMEFVRPAQ
ncbi:MAG: MOP flippase family protein [Sideroxyarcus sp.]|nr:MOP flippase family protein [Sideroxyarcus sp.]